MVKTNNDVLGIIFPNSYDTLTPELVNVRLMASIPFASRYRMIDFVLSSMVNSGIGNVSVIVRKNYHSLMDHLGSGREWDLTRKNGGLNIVPPFADKEVKVYGGRVEALASIIDFLKHQNEKYVLLSDTNVAGNFDYKKIVKSHIESGADVTVVYAADEIPQGLIDINSFDKEMYYTMDVEEDGRISKIEVNSKKAGVQNLSMNMYVIDRELLIEKISEAYRFGHIHFELDILIPNLKELKILGYKYDGYKVRISDTKSYFDENLKLLDDANLDALFGAAPIYTKIRDDNPTRYVEGAKVSNIMAADGCVIEGEVENSVLFRGVKVGKGAKVKNCVLMQDTVVEAGASLEYVISDKDVTITEGKDIKGTDTFPVFIAKGRTV